MSNILHFNDNKFTRYEPIPSRTRHRLQFTQANIVQHTITEINTPITPHYQTQTKIYTVQPYCHTHISTILHKGNNVAKFTLLPEFPTDNTLHIYTTVQANQSNSGIILSNNKISHIIVIELVPITNKRCLGYVPVHIQRTLRRVHNKPCYVELKSKFFSTYRVF
jgi:hypothetical protein